MVTPVLNCEEFVSECIKSVEQQNYADYEHIFVDGGSTDNTIKLITNSESYIRKRISLIHAPSTNACQAWNIGIEETDGYFIGWLGADDKANAGSFNRLKEIHEQNPEEEFIYGDAETINSKGEKTGRYATKDFEMDQMIGSPCNFAAAVSVFISKTLINKVGNLRTDLNACDFDFFLRCAKIKRPFRVDFTFSQYRIHDGGISGSKGGEIYPKEFFQIARDHGAKFFSQATKVYFFYLLKKLFSDKLSDRGNFIYYGNLVKRSISSVKNPAIFGASITGKECYDYLVKNNKPAICFIDNFPPLSRNYQDLPVYLPNEFIKIKDSVETVLLASGKSNPSMRSQLKKLKFNGTIVEWRDLKS
ncbi:glycosyltransferase [Opitutales bacterium]|nr:glycosyltransferase [Opitutales bacterium]